MTIISIYLIQKLYFGRGKIWDQRKSLNNREFPGHKAGDTSITFHLILYTLLKQPLMP